MTTEEKILDEIVDILDYFGYATAGIIDDKPKWSGNVIPIGSDGKTISSTLLRRKINILINDNRTVKRKFQLHYDNISKIASEIGGIKLLPDIKKAILPAINNDTVSAQLSDTLNHPNLALKDIIPVSLQELNTKVVQATIPFNPQDFNNNIIPL